jgi:hypothetical protein
MWWQAVCWEPDVKRHISLSFNPEDLCFYWSAKANVQSQPTCSPCGNRAQPLGKKSASSRDHEIHVSTPKTHKGAFTSLSLWSDDCCEYYALTYNTNTSLLFSAQRSLFALTSDCSLVMRLRMSTAITPVHICLHGVDKYNFNFTFHIWLERWRLQEKFVVFKIILIFVTIFFRREEDVSSYWMTLRKREATGNWKRKH